MKVAIFGASGFVGAAVAERLLRGGVPVTAVIHSSGNAWRLARAAMPMVVADIAKESEIEAALQGCSHVVNCTRASDAVMHKGLSNLLKASRKNQIRRFVHLSSVAVYGDPPPSESTHENAPARPVPGSYGAGKLLQDEAVGEASRAGLDCVILCPPNITGAYSSFLHNLLSDMRKGSFALVDGGGRPVNTVDIENLAQAIVLALMAPKGDAQRIFITDGAGKTWKDLADALLPLAELDEPVPVIPAESISSETPAAAARGSLLRSLKHLVSSDVREALRRDPLLAKLDQRIRGLVARSSRVEERLRDSIEGPKRVAKVAGKTRFSSRYNAMQLRGVWHEIDRAETVLGYKPELRFDDSMAAFRLWYQAMHGWGSDYWPLVRKLNDSG